MRHHRLFVLSVTLLRRKLLRKVGLRELRWPLAEIDNLRKQQTLHPRLRYSLLWYRQVMYLPLGHMLMLAPTVWDLLYLTHRMVRQGSTSQDLKRLTLLVHTLLLSHNIVTTRSTSGVGIIDHMPPNLRVQATPKVAH